VNDSCREMDTLQPNNISIEPKDASHDEAQLGQQRGGLSTLAVLGWADFLFIAKHEHSSIPPLLEKHRPALGVV
jgi:hypothetical protein